MTDSSIVNIWHLTPNKMNTSLLDALFFSWNRIQAFVKYVYRLPSKKNHVEIFQKECTCIGDADIVFSAQKSWPKIGCI